MIRKFHSNRPIYFFVLIALLVGVSGRMSDMKLVDVNSSKQSSDQIYKLRYENEIDPRLEKNLNALKIKATHQNFGDEVTSKFLLQLTKGRTQIAILHNRTFSFGDNENRMVEFIACKLANGQIPPILQEKILSPECPLG